MDLISVIIPVFNRKEELLKTIKSISSQSYKNIEILIVDDGSTEFSVKDLDLSMFPKITRTIRQENKGACAARNIGFEHAQGAFCIFWDADTIALRHNALETLHNALTNEKAVFAYADMKWGQKQMNAQEFDYRQLKKQNYIHTTALLKQEAFPGFDESLTKFQDWDVWLTIAKQGGQGVYVPQTLFKSEPGGTMSSWLPKCAYKKPWKWIPGIKERVDKYEHAKALIFEKHNITPS